MKEQRREQRLHLDDSTGIKVKLKHYYRVFNRDSNEFLGYLMDISSKGVMLLSNSAISKEQKFRMRIELPESMPGNAEWYLSTISAWCEKDINPEYYRIGFALVGTSPQLENLITSLAKDTTLRRADDFQWRDFNRTQ